MRISEDFYFQVFLYQNVLYIVFQSSIKGAIQDFQKAFEIKLLQK